MTNRETWGLAKSMFGDKPYQKRARLALPLLVRQAWQQNPIYYQELADELEMPNARNLNYVLGSIGTTLVELGKKWNEKIPEIQSLVLNQNSGQPGPGFFGGVEEFKKLNKRQRESVLEAQRTEIYSYPKWRDVLMALELEPPATEIDKRIDEATEFQSGGESEAHKRLKLAIAENPALVGLPRSAKSLGVEYGLPSGDLLDVLLEHRQTQYAIEVKSSISAEADIVRGMFQCVKYQAVLEAWRSYQQREVDVEVILALGAKLPPELVPLKNALQVRIVDDIKFEESINA